MRILRSILLGLLILLVVAVAGFAIWGLTPSQPMPEALAAMQSDSVVKVENAGWLEFSPTALPPTTGFIFYPGGHVDYRAYAPLARAIAERGYLVALQPMPLSLAVLSPSAAKAVIAAHPEITAWAIGGHSLGGAMAANFAWSSPGAVQGLVLLGAYPAENNNLSHASISVLSISANRDGLATPAKIAASRDLLPAGTIWVTVAGGNHAQFGWYGDQPGDNPAEISRGEQQNQVVNAVSALLASLKEFK